MVYPNPTRSNVTLALNSPENGNAAVVIYDNMGRIMKKVSFVKTHTIFQQQLNIASFERGMYYVDIMIGIRTRMRTKFIKQ